MGHVFGAKPFEVLEDSGAPGSGLSPLDANTNWLVKARDGRRGREGPGSTPSDEQFFIFQLAHLGGNHLTAVDPHETEPSLAGSADEPDVLAALELISFHAPQSLVDRGFIGASLRLDVGEDAQSRNVLEPLYWAVAAGLDLRGLISNGDNGTRRNFRQDFSPSMNSRPIAIRGGLANLRLEMVAHKPEPWWRGLFRIGDDPVAGALVSALGFPGILPEALKIIDEAFEHFTDDTEILLSSQPRRYALSALAKEEFTGGMPGIDMASLNPGFLIVARSADFRAIRDAGARFMAGYDKLVPAGFSLDDLHEGAENPLDQLTYAILRLKARVQKPMTI